MSSIRWALVGTSDFALEWTPGSRVHYHGLSAHWTLGMLIEAVTGKDFRDVIRELVIEPLGLGRDLFVGLPEAEFGRAADMHAPGADGTAGEKDSRNRRLSYAPGEAAQLFDLAKDPLERARISRVFEQGLESAVGTVLPIARDHGNGRRWRSGTTMAATMRHEPPPSGFWAAWR